ncbi:MAG TPA: EAL domain-containing response regulator [Steroidobacteraceae bacterium]|jgi:EAL domain-containing protein (putative c-di-GMP-specific phosphodiesterase class I)/ActR/RegA family two-component response regulator|nr:EAL domain-containing response regulator [Steroidobacteraceae bacterium]
MSEVRLLILDDDLNMGQAMRQIAEDGGVDARFTPQIDAFFSALDEWNPTHVAIDLVMPEMDGVEVLVQLARRKTLAQVIITSGLESRVLDAASRSASEHGLRIAGVLSKPFSPRALRALLVDTAPGVDQSGDSRSTSTAEPVASQGSFEVTVDELRRAYAMRELHLVYQPQIECDSGRLVGFEALVRWSHPVHGLIMPDQFIAFAESHHLIDELTDVVLEQGIAWITQAFPGSDFTLAVNLSSRSVQPRSATSERPGDAPLVKRIKALCRAHGLDPSRLILELTETSAMEDPVSSLQLLTRLRMNGVQLSLDDFGTGYSSMLQLVRLPLSEIKVDKSFVATAIRSPESHAVVKSIVDLGRSLEMRVVAEGVEDSDTLRYLRDIGCEMAQGYFIARPMTGAAILEWTAREASRLVPDAAQRSFL